MKSLCVVLLLGLAMPGCSMFTKTGRIDRAYYRQLKQVKAEREKRRQQTIQRRATMVLPHTPPPLEQNVQTQTESQ